MTTNTIDRTSLINAIYSAARGSYQMNLLHGFESWSGSTLTGKARKYGSHYAHSRRAMVARINEALPEGYQASVDLVGEHSGSRQPYTRPRRHLVVRDSRGRIVFSTAD